MFVVTVEFQIAPEHINEFMPAMVENAQLSLSNEEGCKVFDVCQDVEAPNRIFLYEVYQTATDFKIHLKSPHFLSFDSKVSNWIMSKKVETWNRQE